jgi:hypothetical protein
LTRTLQVTALLLAAALAGCAASLPQPEGETAAGATASPRATTPMLPTLSDTERATGWRLLFDGRSLSGWRGYGRADMPAGWEARDGMLVRASQAADIITTERFRNFELSLDWMVHAAGNSGIFYRAAEGHDAIYMSAPEMQVLDDAGHQDGRSPLTSAGANYGLYPAPRGVVRPAGEWNTARVLVNGNHVEHWLNGHKVVEYELHGADWKAKVAASKFRDWPAYGQAAEGHIGLQEHGDYVAFRNIKVRVLP